MANIALGKKILEDWVRPEELTNGNYENYNSNVGFTHSPWPKYLTLDLEGIFEIETIRFLLWDKNSRFYKYRLLTSEDLNIWNVHFDSTDNGCRGWQEFFFEDKLKIRYIRLHCLFNSDNPQFHLVQLQAYDSETVPLLTPIDNKKTFFKKNSEEITEIGTGLPLTNKLKILINNLEQIIQVHKIINPEPIKNIIDGFNTQANDLEALEKSIDSIRREIINPVKQELATGNKLGKFSVWGFYVGIIALVVTAISLYYTTFLTPEQVQTKNQNVSIVNSRNEDLEYIKNTLNEISYSIYGLNDKYKPTDKEYLIKQLDKEILLKNDSMTFSVEAYILREKEINNEYFPVASLSFYLNGKQIGPKGLKDLVKIINFSKVSDYDSDFSSILITENDRFILFGKYTYEIKRIFRKKSQILKIADEKDAVLIKLIN